MFLSTDLDPRSFFDAFVEKFRVFIHREAEFVLGGGNSSPTYDMDLEDAKQELLNHLWSVVLKDACRRDAREGYCVRVLRNAALRLHNKRSKQVACSYASDMHYLLGLTSNAEMDGKWNGLPLLRLDRDLSTRRLEARSLIKRLLQESREGSHRSETVQLVLRFLLDPPQELLDLPSDESSKKCLGVGYAKDIAKYLGINQEYLMRIIKQLRKEFKDEL